MVVQVTIRDVPRKVRDELASRAASEGKSMQEYLRGELERLASRPASATILARIRERKSMSPRRIEPEQILSARDVNRK